MDNIFMRTPRSRGQRRNDPVDDAFRIMELMALMEEAKKKEEKEKKDKDKKGWDKIPFDKIVMVLGAATPIVWIITLLAMK